MGACRPNFPIRFNDDVFFFGIPYPRRIWLTFAGCGTLNGTYAVDYDEGGGEYQYVVGTLLITVTPDTPGNFTGFDTESGSGDSCAPPSQPWDGVSTTVWAAGFSGAPPDGTITISPRT